MPTNALQNDQNYTLAHTAHWCLKTALMLAFLFNNLAHMNIDLSSNSSSTPEEDYMKGWLGPFIGTLMLLYAAIEVKSRHAHHFERSFADQRRRYDFFSNIFSQGFFVFGQYGMGVNFSSAMSGALAPFTLPWACSELYLAWAHRKKWPALTREQLNQVPPAWKCPFTQKPFIDPVRLYAVTDEQKVLLGVFERSAALREYDKSLDDPTNELVRAFRANQLEEDAVVSVCLETAKECRPIIYAALANPAGIDAGIASLPPQRPILPIMVPAEEEIIEIAEDDVEHGHEGTYAQLPSAPR